MRRFFTEEENIKENQVTVKGDEARHIIQVLRAKKGNKIKVFTGEGREYLIEIIGVNKKEVVGNILEQAEVKTEPGVSITLVQGIPKSDKMAFILQKTTELGVKRIIPVITERTIVRLNREKARVRRNRWQRIVLEAAKQSGRAVIPKVDEIVTFLQSLNSVGKESLKLIPWEEEETTSLKEVLEHHTSHTPHPTSHITIFIGPEGGFTSEEVRRAKGIGAIPVSLGPRLLRTETASLTTVAMILYELGDLG